MWARRFRTPRSWPASSASPPSSAVATPRWCCTAATGSGSTAAPARSRSSTVPDPATPLRRFSGQVAGDDVREGHPLEHRSLVSAQRDPHPLQRRRRSRVRHVFRPLAADPEQLAVDGPDDLGQRNLPGRPGEPEAAVWPAPAAHDVATPQVGQDGLEELSGNALGLSEVLSRDMVTLRRGELDGGAQRVVGAGGQSHERYYPLFRSL